MHHKELNDLWADFLDEKKTLKKVLKGYKLLSAIILVNTNMKNYFKYFIIKTLFRKCISELLKGSQIDNHNFYEYSQKGLCMFKKIIFYLLFFEHFNMCLKKL